jgi:predicted ribosome quality control (RQC) complex YloA/Tae2 family protein
MRKMSNLEYSFIVTELSSVVGKHFQRIRKLGEATYRMKIGNAEILCQLGVRLHRTKYIEEAGPSDRFVQRLEKELDNAKLLSIEQVNEDRIVAFDFDKGRLILEMFGEGNAVLVREGKIVAAYKSEKWAGREIKPGAEYRPPDMRPATKLEPSDRYIIVSLVKLPFGKEYALEALARLGIDEKTPGNKLSKEQLSGLEVQLNKIRSSAKPYSLMEEGKPVDFSLAPLSSYPEAKEMPTLSEAIDEYYAALEGPDERLEKLKRRLEKQKERLKALKEEEKLNRMKGDFIYEHYNEVEEIIESAKKGEFRDWKADKKEKTAEADIQ